MNRLTPENFAGTPREKSCVCMSGAGFLLSSAAQGFTYGRCYVVYGTVRPSIDHCAARLNEHYVSGEGNRCIRS